MGDSYIAKNALVTFDGTDFTSAVTDTTDFNLDITSTTDEYVPFGGDGWTSRLQGVKSASYSWTSSLDKTLGINLALTVGTSGELIIDTVDGKTYTGNAIITGASISGDAQTRALVSWTADSNGALVESG